MTPPTRVAVNGRFLARPVTGVERYASELLTRLPDELGVPCEVLRPAAPTTGVRGHVWEQVQLPRQFRASGADVLIGLANLGPVSVASQLVVIHDVAPFLVPELFNRAYGIQVRQVQRLLARRCRVATVSERARSDLVDVLDIDRREIAIVPPAVGAPFTEAHDCAPEPRAVMVGGHDPRKNVGFLLDLWPDVYRATGMELHVAARSGSETLRSTVGSGMVGVRWRWDLDDQELAVLYRSSTVVLSPSLYEGFGFPLLEGMACGTPFLATDTGAAAEFAVRPAEQVLPLRPDEWVAQLAAWARNDLSELRAASRHRAQQWTWERSARALAAVVMGEES